MMSSDSLSSDTDGHASGSSPVAPPTSPAVHTPEASAVSVQLKLPPFWSTGKKYFVVGIFLQTSTDLPEHFLQLINIVAASTKNLWQHQGCSH